MKFIIKHEIKGRIRIHLVQSRMTCEQADTLLYYLDDLSCVTYAKVYERTCAAVISYTGSREHLIEKLKQFRYENVMLPTGLLENSSRELNAVYEEKLIQKVIIRGLKQFVIPYPLVVCHTAWKSVRYIWKGVQSLMARKLDVSVLDAIAIAVSMVRGDVQTAGSVMFLLGVGELLEEWTHKKSVEDLARSLSLNVSKVWLKREEQEILVPVSDVEEGDLVVVRMGNIIPFDGVVVAGEAMVNQASLTGESIPVRRGIKNTVYAGTVVEMGNKTVTTNLDKSV